MSSICIQVLRQIQFVKLHHVIFTLEYQGFLAGILIYLNHTLYSTADHRQLIKISCGYRPAL